MLRLQSRLDVLNKKSSPQSTVKTAEEIASDVRAYLPKLQSKKGA
jgi:hypothetical protein